MKETVYIFNMISESRGMVRSLRHRKYRKSLRSGSPNGFLPSRRCRLPALRVGVIILWCLEWMA